MKYEWSDLPGPEQMAFMQAFQRILERLTAEGYVVKKSADFVARQMFVYPWAWAAAEVVMNAPRRKVTENRRRRLTEAECRQRAAVK